MNEDHVGEIIAEIRETGGWAPVVNWIRDHYPSHIGQKLYTSPMPGWQPIETAPKDGTTVLLYISKALNRLDDAIPITIGNYGVNGGPEEDPTWTFAGWDWCHDE